jgi:hypothetical protein
VRFSPGCGCCLLVQEPPVPSGGCQTGGTLNSTNITINRSGQTDIDSLYLAAIGYDTKGGLVNLTSIPAGWVTLYHTTAPGAFTNGATYRMWVGYRKPEVSEPSSWTWQLSGNSSSSGFTFHLEGADTVSSSSVNTGTGAVSTATSVDCSLDVFNWAVHLRDSFGSASYISRDSDGNIMAGSCSAGSALNFLVASYSRTAPPSAPTTGDNTLEHVSGTPTEPWVAVNLVVDPW